VQLNSIIIKGKIKNKDLFNTKNRMIMTVIKKEWKALNYALTGIQNFLIKEDHGKVHLLATIITILLLIVLPTTVQENAIVIVVITIVWAAEMFNSAVEKTLDIVMPLKSREVAYIKDVMAGAVFIASVCSLAVAVFILVPKIFNYVF
jgi:diacylglycerol kinase (ATP)